MLPIFKNYTEEQRRKALNRMLLTFGITVFLLGSIFAIYSFYKNSHDYSFILNGEKVNSIMVCENEWHYEKLQGFIPCVVNKTVGGLSPNVINWSISPQENCARFGGEFTGLNIQNQTRSKELYDSLLPKCFEMNKKYISNEWLNNSKCVCLGDIKDIFVPNCNSYDCGGGLIVRR